jgi:hypothetical protein
MEKYIALRLARHIQSRPDYAWDWGRLSFHPHLTPEVIDIFIDKSWDWDEISNRVPLWVVLKYMEKPWNWRQLTVSDHIPVCEMIQHSTLPWDISYIGFDSVTQNEIPFLRTFAHRMVYADWVDHTMFATWKTIRTNMDLPWKEADIVFKPGDITSYEDVCALRRLDRDMLDWNTLSSVADYSIISRYPEFPWVPEYVSKNPTLPWPLPNAPIPLNLHDVPIEPVEYTTRRWKAAIVIQRQWHQSYTNPEYAMCRRLLNAFISGFMGEIGYRNVST